MNGIKFEKVSFSQFEKDCKKIGLWNDNQIKEAYEGLKLPKRATDGSAGYDFITPFSFDLIPFGTNWSTKDFETAMIPTGIRVKMPKGVALILMPRSGLGFKTGMRLSNTLGLIDEDYYLSENEEQ